MADGLSVEMLTRMLEKMPGVAFCSRMDPVTMQTRWVYVDKKAAALYDVDEAELLADPMASLKRMDPTDRARVEMSIGRAVQEGAPMAFVGRTIRRDGRVTWLETHANVERDSDGSILWYGQSLDVTERKELEASLAASETARARAEAISRQVVDALPVGVMLANQAYEFQIMNPAQVRMTGGIADHSSKEVTRAYGVYKADGETLLPMEESGMVRALAGEALEEEVVIKNPRRDGEVRAHIVWTPLEVEGGEVLALGTAQDITLQRALEAELRFRNEELAKSEEAKTDLIKRLRLALDELSNPILEVWDGVLAMPVIGIVDSRRTADMVQRLLGEVTRMQASFVIVDLTGVEVVDTRTADHLMRLMKKVEVVGARCVLTGIRPAVAETLVDIGVDFGRLSTLRNLKHGLREALRLARRDREGLAEQQDDEEPADEARSRRRSR